jgi:hypothetical protein
MVRQTDSHFPPTGPDQRGDPRAPGHHQGESARPETLRQAPCEGRHGVRDARELLDIAYHDRQRHALGPSFRLEDPLHGGFVEGVGPKAIEGVRGVGNQAATPQHVHGLGERVVPSGVPFDAAQSHSERVLRTRV